jgi:hypothetical protein
MRLIIITLAVVVIVFILVMHATKPVTSVKSAGIQANKLIASVGGPSIVCGEAAQMFKRFGVSKEQFFESSELKGFPAIAALGNAVRIVPGNPSLISIRVGTHIDGFFIEVADTNNPAKYVKPPSTLEIVDSCVFVHR